MMSILQCLCIAFYLIWLHEIRNATCMDSKQHNQTISKKPNILLFVADDFGYGDLSVYGHPTQEWGAVDQMAIDGMKFTQFYATSVFCSPSRTAILTGRMPFRIGAYGEKPVFLPNHSTGLPLQEITIAESLKELGYKTGMVGKWHLGMNKDTYTDQYYFPQNQGFDFVGTFLPFTLEDTCDEDQIYRFQPKRSKCFVYYNRTILQQPIQLDSLSPAMVQDMKAFLYENENNPFFFYFALPQTHIPFFNQPDFRNKSKRGPYGDQVNAASQADIERFSQLSEVDNALWLEFQPNDLLSDYFIQL